MRLFRSNCPPATTRSAALSFFTGRPFALNLGRVSCNVDKSSTLHGGYTTRESTPQSSSMCPLVHVEFTYDARTRLPAPSVHHRERSIVQNLQTRQHLRRRKPRTVVIHQSSRSPRARSCRSTRWDSARTPQSGTEEIFSDGIRRRRPMVSMNTSGVNAHSASNPNHALSAQTDRRLCTFYASPREPTAPSSIEPLCAVPRARFPNFSPPARSTPRRPRPRPPHRSSHRRGRRRRVHAAHDVPSRNSRGRRPRPRPDFAAMNVDAARRSVDHVLSPIALPSLARASLRRRDRREQHAAHPHHRPRSTDDKPQHRARARLACRRRRRRSQHRASIPSSSLGARLQRVRQVHEEKREERPRERHRAVVPTRELASVVERHDIESSGRVHIERRDAPCEEAMHASKRHPCARGDGACRPPRARSNGAWRVRSFARRVAARGGGWGSGQSSRRVRVSAAAGTCPGKRTTPRASPCGRSRRRRRRRGKMHVVLVTPKIPGNTGCIARTCAAARVPLHLVGPRDADDAQLKRAGLDYWKSCVRVHDDWEAFYAYWRGLERPGRLVAFSKFGARPHAE